jgi:hypothetical protein
MWLLIPKLCEFWVLETVTRPVSFNVRGLRQVLKTNNVTDLRYGHRHPDRETKPFYLFNN